jgi:hypothetical protein
MIADYDPVKDASSSAILHGETTPISPIGRTISSSTTLLRSSVTLGPHLPGVWAKCGNRT